MLSSNSDGVLTGREAMGHLRTNSSTSQGADYVVV